MRRTTILLAAAVVVSGVIAGGGTTASARSAKKVNTVKVQCRITLTQQPALGADAVLPADSGTHLGRINCHHGFGWGVIRDTFTVPDSGDTVAKYVAYFSGGTFSGTFNLTPGGGEDLSTTSFQTSSWTGTMTVDGGTGIYKGIGAAKKGEVSCTSADSVHIKCTDSMSLVLPR